MNNENKISFNIQTYSQVLQWYDQFLWSIFAFLSSTVFGLTTEWNSE